MRRFSERIREKLELENHVERLKREVVELERRKQDILASASTHASRVLAHHLTPSISTAKIHAKSPMRWLVTMADDLYHAEYTSCDWNQSPFESLDKLKSDCSGKVGELFIAELCKQANIPYVYAGGNKNSRDGTYDIRIGEAKVEIKTSKLGKYKVFQHENLRLHGYDYLLFLDITPDSIYLTILPRFDMREESSVLAGRKAHLRKGTTDVYKLDFTERTLERLQESGHTLYITPETTLETIAEFMRESLVALPEEDRDWDQTPKSRRQ